VQFFDNPEEMKAHLKEAADRQEMETSVVVHSVSRLFNTMDEDQLQSLARILGAVAVNSNPSGLASFYQGVALALMSEKHGRCLGCGTNHSTELDELSGTPSADTPEL
jgi:hypothetical protein